MKSHLAEPKPTQLRSQARLHVSFGGERKTNDRFKSPSDRRTKRKGHRTPNRKRGCSHKVCSPNRRKRNTKKKRCGLSVLKGHELIINRPKIKQFLINKRGGGIRRSKRDPQIDNSKRGVTGIPEGEGPEERGQGAREGPNQIHSHLVALGYNPISGPRDRIISQTFCKLSGGGYNDPVI